jgi:hypothetical protein
MMMRGVARPPLGNVRRHSPLTAVQPMVRGATIQTPLAMRNNLCPVCGRAFQAARLGRPRRYCSATCRTIASQARHALPRLVRRLRVEGDDPGYWLSDRVEHLRALVRRIDAQAAIHPAGHRRRRAPNREGRASELDLPGRAPQSTDQSRRPDVTNTPRDQSGRWTTEVERLEAEVAELQRREADHAERAAQMPPAGHGGEAEAARAEGRAPAEFVKALDQLRGRQIGGLRRLGLEGPEPSAPPSTQPGDFGGGGRSQPQPEKAPTPIDLMRAIHARRHW